MITGDLKPMARRKKSRAPRRNRSKGINVLNAAEVYVQSSIWTEKLLNVNPFEMVTGITEGVYKPAADGGERITIPELLKGFQGGSYADTPTKAIARNITGKTNPDVMEVGTALVMPAIQTALVGVGFKFGKKLTSKPRAAINRGLRQFGLGDFIRF